MNDFRFDEATHKYYLGNEELPGVTRVLSPLNDFSMIAPEVLQHAADRGKAVHRAVELFCADDLDEDSLCDEIKPYFAAFKQFYAEKRPKIISSEQAVYHAEFRYAGTMDLLLELPATCYVDIKCTAQLSKTAAIQLNAYQHAHSDMLNDLSLCNADRATLRLKKNGTYQFVTHHHEHFLNDWNLFLILLNKVHANVAADKEVAAWKFRTKGLK